MTEPHYDKSNNYDFLSIWIPLKKSNIKTGSLCHFQKENLKINFPIEGKNLLSISKYISEHKKIDPLIRESIVPVYCEEGAYLYWSPKVLHGATKPVSEPRISINYQVFDIKNSISSLKTSEEYAVLIFSRYPIIFCFCMLIGYGDYKGAKRIINDIFNIELNKLKIQSEEFEKLFFNFVKNNLCLIDSKTSKPSTSKVHWSKDYEWIRKLYNINN